MNAMRASAVGAGVVAAAIGGWLAYRWLVQPEPFGPVWRLGPAAADSARPLGQSPAVHIVFHAIPHPAACIVKIEPPSIAAVQRDVDGTFTTLRMGEVVRVALGGHPAPRPAAIDLRLDNTAEGSCWIQSRAATTVIP